MAGKKSENHTHFTLRLVVIALSCALAFAVGLSSYSAYRYRLENKRIKASEDVLVYAKDDELAALKIEQRISKAVEDAYATYQADMQNILAVAGIIFTLFSIGVPLMQYQFMTKERVNEFDEKIAALKGNLEKVEEMKRDIQALKDDVSRAKATYETAVYKQFGTTTVGMVIPFGGLDWLVLRIVEGRALLITKDIVKLMPYHEFDGDITWEHCSLRKYLNGEFYGEFSEDDRKRIEPTQNQNPNTRYVTADGKTEVNTRGGNPTRDSVFLLSIEEAKQCFHTTEKEILSDWDDVMPKTYPQSDEMTAEYGKEPAWWWLRSPGINQYDAANVFGEGSINLGGRWVNSRVGGVRPALWLNLESDIA
ncbi:MAG: DUF6273 domain-containing protein [Oscillospiraceae bacterium]|nr:DUF6273 domain-containing protein [Oscillospiraceae bacterium]